MSLVKYRTWDFFHTLSRPLLSILYFLGAKILFSLQWNVLSWPRARLRRVHWSEQTPDQPYIGHQITQPENQKDFGGPEQIHFQSDHHYFGKIFCFTLDVLWLLVSCRSAVWRISVEIAPQFPIPEIILTHICLKFKRSILYLLHSSYSIWWMEGWLLVNIVFTSNLI